MSTALINDYLRINLRTSLDHTSVITAVARNLCVFSWAGPSTHQPCPCDPRPRKKPRPSPPPSINIYQYLDSGDKESGTLLKQ